MAVQNTMYGSPVPYGQQPDPLSQFFGGAGQVAAGIGGLVQARPDYNLAKQYADMATQPATAAYNQLNALMQNPNMVTTMPGYQFGMSQGMEAVNRGAGASGLLNSGNRLLALQNFGQEYAGSWLDRMYNMLRGNVGAAIGVGGLDLGAGQFLTQAKQNQGMNVGGGLADLLTGLGGMAPGVLQLLRLLGGGGDVNSVGGVPGNETGWPGSSEDLVPSSPSFSDWTGVDLAGGSGIDTGLGPDLSNLGIGP